jgi:hypothetical protein
MVAAWTNEWHQPNGAVFASPQVPMSTHDAVAALNEGISPLHSPRVLRPAASRKYVLASVCVLRNNIGAIRGRMKEALQAPGYSVPDNWFVRFPSFAAYMPHKDVQSVMRDSLVRARSQPAHQSAHSVASRRLC